MIYRIFDPPLSYPHRGGVHAAYGAGDLPLMGLGRCRLWGWGSAAYVLPLEKSVLPLEKSVLPVEKSVLPIDFMMIL